MRWFTQRGAWFRRSSPSAFRCLVIVNSPDIFDPLLELRDLVRVFVAHTLLGRRSHVGCQLLPNLGDVHVRCGVLEQQVLDSHGVIPLPETLIALPHAEDVALEVVLPSGREECASEPAHEILEIEHSEPVLVGVEPPLDAVVLERVHDLSNLLIFRDIFVLEVPFACLLESVKDLRRDVTSRQHRRLVL